MFFSDFYMDNIQNSKKLKKITKCKYMIVTHKQWSYESGMIYNIHDMIWIFSKTELFLIVAMGGMFNHCACHTISTNVCCTCPVNPHNSPYG